MTATLFAFVAAKAADGGIPLEVEQRLLKIDVRQCEVATASNVGRVSNDSQGVVDDLPKGLMIVADVTHIRRIRWDFAAALMGVGRPPTVGMWTPLAKPLRSDFFYVSRVATCAPFLKRRTWIVSSVDNADCDTEPPFGMCVFDDHKIISFISRDAQYVSPVP